MARSAAGKERDLIRSDRQSDRYPRLGMVLLLIDVINDMAFEGSEVLLK